MTIRSCFFVYLSEEPLLPAQSTNESQMMPGSPPAGSQPLGCCVLERGRGEQAHLSPKNTDYFVFCGVTFEKNISSATHNNITWAHVAYEKNILYLFPMQTAGNTVCICAKIKCLESVVCEMCLQSVPDVISLRPLCSSPSRRNAWIICQHTLMVCVSDGIECQFSVK